AQGEMEPQFDDLFVVSEVERATEDVGLRDRHRTRAQARHGHPQKGKQAPHQYHEQAEQLEGVDHPRRHVPSSARWCPYPRTGRPHGLFRHPFSFRGATSPTMCRPILLMKANPTSMTMTNVTVDSALA